MSEINLLNNGSDTRVSSQAAGKAWTLRLAGAAFIATLLLYGYLFYSGWSAQKTVDKDQAAISAFQNNINSNKQRKELVTRQGQIKNANTLISEHMSWSYLLPELARVTVQSASYTNIIATSTGALDLTVTVPSYAEADKYLQVFNLPEYNKEFSNVRIMSLVRAQQEDQLQTVMRLQLTYNPEFLKK